MLHDCDEGAGGEWIMCRDTAAAETKALSESILEGRCKNKANYDASWGKVRDLALLEDRTRRVWVSVNSFWLRGHDWWRQGAVQRSGCIPRGAMG